MIIRQFNSQSADTIRANFKNVSGATMTANMPVHYVVTGTASIDGISAVQSGASDPAGWGGVATETVANNGFGVTHAVGYYASCLLSNEGTSITFTLGDALVPEANVGLTSSVGTFAWNLTKKAYLLETVTVSASAYVKALYNCLG